MAPEAIQSQNSVDPRSDLYAVGAVGYFLLTGTPVFDAASIVELCHMHVDVVPETPSQRLGKPISQELEGAILACLEKSRAKRPQTARDLAQILVRRAAACPWSIEDAENWWNMHERRGATRSTTGGGDTRVPSSSVVDRTVISGQTDLD
jgi:serine/threonine protein kinase